MNETEIRKAVKERYGRLAGKKTPSCCATSCCDDKVSSGIYNKEAFKYIP